MQKILITLIFFVVPHFFFGQDDPKALYESYQVDVKPKFPGGDEKLKKYLKDSLRYPEEEKKKGISGEVKVQFIVNYKGEITDVQVVKGVYGGEGLSKEALRLVKAMPKWSTGKKEGRPVNVKMTLYVSFKLDNPPPPQVPTSVSVKDMKDGQVGQEGEVTATDVLVEQKADEPLVYAEEMPEFPGGQEALAQYLAKNIKYPQMEKENGI